MRDAQILSNISTPLSFKKASGLMQLWARSISIDSAFKVYFEVAFSYVHGSVFWRVLHYWWFQRILHGQSMLVRSLPPPPPPSRVCLRMPLGQSAWAGLTSDTIILDTWHSLSFCTRRQYWTKIFGERNINRWHTKNAKHFPLVNNI